MAKSYSNFTFRDLSDLGVTITEQSLFSENEYQKMEPSAWLLQTLAFAKELPKETEKAKSELIITPILIELAQVNNFKFRFFSGYNFDVDKQKGLKGQCDFLLNKSPHVPYVDAPVFAIVEAKKGDFELGTPQLIAQLHAAFLFNQNQNKPLTTIYGVVTIGSQWLFVKYEQNQAYIDTQNYYVQNLPQLLGVMQHILNNYI